MGKIKIHEIAKEMGLASKEIIARAKEMGYAVTSHLSGISEEEAKKLKASLGEKKASKKEEIKKAEKTEKKPTSSPVIIRKVIINEEEEEEKKEEKKSKEAEQRSKQVGFVERNKSADYNIVYRNKPTKPMTVSELFGFGKKEEKNKQEEKEEVVVKQEEVVKEPQKENEKKEEEEIVRQETMIEAKQRPVEENKKQESTHVASNEEESKNNVSRNANYAQPTNGQSTYQNRNGYQGNNNYVRRDGTQNSNNNNYARRDGTQTNNGQNNYQNRNGYQGNNNYVRREGNQTNNGQSTYQNRNGNGYQGNNNYVRRDGTQTNNGQSTYQNRNGNGYQGNRENTYQNRNGNGYQGNRDNTYANRNGNNNFRNNNTNRPNNFNRDRRPLDDKGIDKNIKDIISIDIVEKESQRDYASKAIDKVKNEKYEDKSKKANKSKKTGRFQEEINDGKLKDLKQVDKLSNMFDDQEGGMLDYYDLTTERGKKNKKKANRNQQDRAQKIFKLTEITIPETITVKDLAIELKKTTGEVIKKLLGYGMMATINNDIDFDTAFLVAEEFGVTARKKEEVKEEDILFDETEDTEEELQVRPPVVCVMGHVDHGKTSLLDAIRSTNVIEGEAGGITQTIGAYKVMVNNREITFLDTPGHEAFTSMRARGAQITDIAILIVAANDGVMPQTIEAINHAKAAEVPIIVAVNKIDLPDANVEKVKEELMKYELVPEEWGGETIYVPISAKKHTNIEGLLEMVLLQADMMELKTNPSKQAKGVVIEARLDKSKGPVASVLVQRGTLDVGDTIVVGSAIGRIRAMKNDKGQKVKKAGPSTPVEIMGLTELPESGEIFYEVKDEKMAKHLIERRKRQAREKSINSISRVTLDNLFTQMEKGNLKQLNLIVKADVQGSAEALKQSLEKLSDEEVNVRVINAVAGAVNESDVNLAKVANAIIIAFNVRPVITAKALAEREEVEIKQYSVIYQVIDDVKAAMKGMLDPIFEEKVIGTVEVRQTFKVSNVGTIAGAYVTDGKIERNAGVRVIREEVVIHDGKLASLKRFKDDVKEVAKGYECGIQIEGYNDIKEGDSLEVYKMEEIKR